MNFQLLEKNAGVIGGVEVSEQQKAVWYLSCADEDKIPTFNICPYIRVEGEFDLSILKRTVMELFHILPVFRTYFTIEHGVLVQKVAESLREDQVWSYIDFRYLIDKVDSHTVVEYLSGEALKPIDILNPPLIRFIVIRASFEEYYLSFVAHHLIEDYGSISIIWDYLRAIYNHVYSGGEYNEVRKNIPAYTDYCIWQREQEQSQSFIESGKYWISQFEEIPPPIGLPKDKPRPPVMRYEGSVYKSYIPAAVKTKLGLVAFQNRSSLMLLLLSAYFITLHKYSAARKMVVGTFLSGRDDPKWSDTIGFLSSIYPVLIDIPELSTFKQVLKVVTERVRCMISHQVYPFAKLVEKLNPPRDSAFSPLFQVTFNMLGGNTSTNSFSNVCEDSMSIIELPVSQYDLSLNVLEVSQGLEFSFEYSTNLFFESTIGCVAKGFVEVLSEVILTGDFCIDEFNFKSSNQINSIISPSLNAAPNKQQIHRVIEQCAEIYKDKIAVICGGEILTYNTLNRRANKLAKCLLDHGFEGNNRIGIYADNSLELIVGLLAVLKVGGIYVPLDIRHPHSRLKHICEDASIVYVLYQSECDAFFDEENIRFINVTDDNNFEKYPDDNLHIEHADNAFIYTIYTSGSTGQPKASSVFHTGFQNLLDWYIEEIEIDSSRSVLVCSSLSFDLTQKNVIAPLMVGATLVMSSVKNFDPELIVNQIADHCVSWINCAPSVFNAILDNSEAGDFQSLQTLQHIILGGEPISLSRLEKYRNSRYTKAKIINSYGPTECTDVSTCYTIPNDFKCQSVPIGKPINGVGVLILDENFNSVPDGAVGELCILGEGMTTGYLNNDQLTAEKFVDNPFKNIPYDKLYRSGDRAKLLPDGNIEFLGRIDHQVKYKGIRIELQEIENKIKEIDAFVDECIVVVSEFNGDSTLIAYVQFSTGIYLATQNLSSKLAEHLPRYMIPSRFIQINTVPLTLSGKADRLKLSKMEIIMEPEGQSAALRASTKTEVQLASLWRRLLNNDDFDLNTSFYDAGGHSFLAVMLVAEIKREFGVSVPLMNLFANPVLCAMAATIDDRLSVNKPVVILHETID